MKNQYIDKMLLACKEWLAGKGDDIPQSGETYTDDKSARFAGTIIVLVTFGIFGIWSAVAPMDSAALAPGEVAVKGQRKTIQHLEGGIIKQFFVEDGAKVKAGDVLVSLDETQAKAELQILKGQLFTLEAQESRLVSERDGLDEVQFASSLDVSDSRADDAKRLETQQFQVRKASHEGEIEVFEQRIEQLRAQVIGLQALVNSKQNQIRSYDEEIKDNSELLSEGFVDKTRLRDLQRMRERLVGEKAEHQANIAGVTVQIGEAKLQVLQLQKERRSEVVAQLTETLAKLQDVKERATAVSDRVDRSLIVAPVDGIVLGLGYHTVGGVVAPGNRILDIVPEGAGLLVEAQVSPADIDRVSVGMIADIRFSTFNSSTPVMEGKVIALSAGSLNREDGSSYYLAKVELTDSGQDILDEKKLILVPGMPAEVLINTGARTLLEYLVQPATNAIARSMIEE